MERSRQISVPQTPYPNAIAEAAVMRGLAAETVETVIVLGHCGGDRLEALARELPNLARVATLVPHPVAEPSNAQHNVQHDLLLLTTEAETHPSSVYRALADFFLAKGAAPSRSIVIETPEFVRYPQAPRLRSGVEDLLWGRAAAYVDAASSPLDGDEHKFYANWAAALLNWGEPLHALRFLWVLADAPTVPPALARSIMQAWFALENPGRVLEWVDRCGLPPDQVRSMVAELTALCAERRQIRQARLNENLRHLDDKVPRLAEALRATRAANADLVWLLDHPWEVHARRPEHPVARAEYPLLLRVRPGRLTELNAPDPPRALLAALKAVGSINEGHVCIDSLTRCDALVNVLRNPMWSKCTGLRQLVYGVETDLSQLRRYAEVDDLRPLLNPERVALFWGPQAHSDFLDHFRRHQERPLPGVLISGNTALRDGLATIQRERVNAARTACKSVRDHHTPERASHTLRRLDQQQPLRIWALASRHTTVLQHVARDLAQGFAEHGHMFELLVERDDRDVLDRRAIAVSLAEYRPDLVVLFSHIRPEYGDLFPPGLPVVSWIFDELPQLFDPKLIRRLTGLDLIFAWGPSLADRFSQLGYPRAEVLPFAANPVRYDVRNVVQAEDSVAFATHLNAPSDPPHAPGLIAGLRSLLESSPHDLSESVLNNRVDQVLQDLDLQPPASALARIRFDSLILARHVDRIRVADAILAAGLTLACYGHGWQEIPRFAPYARGVVEPGEPLRALYTRHKVVLHVNSTGCNVHPRVLETLLAGGFPLARSDGELDYVSRGLADNFELGTELCLFRDSRQMVNLIRRAFSDEPWRQSFIVAGRKKVLSNHTFARRAQTMVAALHSALREQRLQRLQHAG